MSWCCNRRCSKVCQPSLCCRCLTLVVQRWLLRTNPAALLPSLSVASTLKKPSTTSTIHPSRRYYKHVTPNVINILKDMYANNQCCGRRDGQHSEWFREDCGKAGMRHLSLLFLVIVSRVIRNATSDRPRCLVSGLNERLRNTDIGLLPFSQKDIQEKGAK